MMFLLSSSFVRAQESPPPVAKADDTPKVILNNITLQQFAESVQRRTKKTFITSDAVAQQFRQIKVQLLAYKEFESCAELLAIFQNVLQVQKERFVLVEAGVDVYKILPQAEALKAGTRVLTASNGAPNDSYVTRIFSLQHVSSQDAFQALTHMATPQAMVQVPSAGMLVVTDSDYNIKRYEEILKAIDIKKPDLVWKRVPLRKAVASDVETMVKNLLQAVLARERSRPGPGPASNEQVTVVADRRTNAITIFAEPGRIDEVEKLVESLDCHPEFETSGVNIIHLKNRDAVDMAATLNRIYKIGTDNRGMPSGGAATARPNQPVGPAPGPSQGHHGGQGLSGSEPTIVADEKANAVLVISDFNTFQMLKKLAERLDRRRPQVLIKATVVEVQGSDTFDLGVELSRVVDPKDTITTLARTTFGQSTIVPRGNTFDVVPVDTPGISLAIIKDRIGNVGALLKALKEKADFSILDEPEAVTGDNGNAEMTITTSVPVLKTTVTGTGIAQQSFENQTADSTLSISPHISEGGYLRLETKVKIEKFIGATGNPEIPPVKTSREIKTNSILVPNGRTVVIGGIVTADSTDQETSVPILGDIPVFGSLFRRNRSTDLRRTLYIFITPYILYDESFGDLRELSRQRIEEIARKGGRVEDLDGLESPDPVPYSMFRFGGAKNVPREPR